MLGRNKKDSVIKETFQQAKNTLNKYKKNLKDFGLKHLNLEKINKGKKYFKKYAMTAAAIGACGITVLTITSMSEREPVLELYYNGQRVGYVQSNDIYDIAKVNAEAELAKLHTIAYRFNDESATYRLRCNVSRPDFMSEDDVRSYLVKDANSYFTDGFGLYIDNTLVAIGENRDDVQLIIDETIKLYSELYAKVKTSNDIIAFNSGTGIKAMSVPKTIVKSKDEIRKILGIDSLENLNNILLTDNSLTDDMSISDISDMMPNLEEITYTDISLGLPVENVYFDSEEMDSESESNSETTVSFKSSSVEVIREVMPCGEEIIYDDKLEKGKKVLVESGIYGIKEITYDVVYIDGVEITRTLIEEEIVKEPIPKKYKIGTGAANNTSSEIKYIGAEPGDTPAVPTGTFIYPTSGILTSGFSGRNVLGAYEFHGALDIANSIGTPVYASDGGTVILAEPFSSYGNCVIIRHDDGFESLYAHLDSFAVKQGDVVGKGWKIGEMGVTGRVTGSHLHFEIRINDVKVDPAEYLN